LIEGAPVAISALIILLLDKLFVGLINHPSIYSGDIRSLAISTNNGMIALLGIMVASITFLRGTLPARGNWEEVDMVVKLSFVELPRGCDNVFNQISQVATRDHHVQYQLSRCKRAIEELDKGVLPLLPGGFDLLPSALERIWSELLRLRLDIHQALSSQLQTEFDSLTENVRKMVLQAAALSIVLLVAGWRFRLAVFATLVTVVIGVTLATFPAALSSPDLLLRSLFLTHAGFLTYGLVRVAQFMIQLVQSIRLQIGIIP